MHCCNALRRVLGVVLGLACLALGLSTAPGATNFVWTNPSGGSWANAAHWQGNLVATGTDNIADFSTLDLANTVNVTLDGSRTIGGLRFSDTVGGSAWNIEPGTGGTLTLAVSAGSPTVAVTGGYAVLNIPLAGTNGLTKTGTSFLQLEAASSYSGGTVLSGSDCRLSIQHDRALGTGSLVLGTTPGAGQVWFQCAGNRTLTNSVEVRTVRFIVDWATVDGNEAGDLTLNGPVFLNQNGGDIWCGRNLTLNGNVTSTGGLKVEGGSTLTLNGANSFNSTVTVNAGRLIVNGPITTPNLVNVTSGDTLEGRGPIAGTAEIQSGGRLVVGSGGAGTLSLGGLNLHSSANLNFALGAPNHPSNGFIQVNGNLILDGVLNVTDLGGFMSGSYTGLSYSGTLTDRGLALGGMPPGLTGRVRTDLPNLIVFQALRGPLGGSSPTNGEAVSVFAASPLRLAWTETEDATAYDLYFGTSSNGVFTAGTNTAGVYRGRVSSLEHTLGPLNPATTYYWRVDAVQPDGSVVRGPVWAFTVGAGFWDTYADTWAALDDRGRAVGEHDAVGEPRTNRTVGVFYYIWHNAHGSSLNPAGQFLDNDRILREHPEIAADPLNTALWEAAGETGNPYYWGEPLFGFYVAPDEWVIRRHAQMLVDAGVDFIYMDNSNGPTYTNALLNLCRIYREIRLAGGRTPQISFLARDSAIYDLWQNFFQKNLYPELWFRWQGKPLILPVAQYTLPYDITNFFTIRESWAWRSGKDRWPWIDDWPQDLNWHDSPSRPEQLPVAVGHHPTSNKGRSLVQGRQPAWGASVPERGLQFAEQWRRVFEIDPEVVTITQWNEWIAGRYVNGPGESIGYLGRPGYAGSTYFVDEFNPEFSRDAEPMKGGYGDNYYWQMVDRIRRYKGARPAPEGSPPKTITLADFNAWTDVQPEFRDSLGDITWRDAMSVGNKLRYTNFTGRTDLKLAKVARDTTHIFFYIEANGPIAPKQGTNWMNLFLKIESDPSGLRGWNGFQFRVAPLDNTPASPLVLWRHDPQATSQDWRWLNRGIVPHALASNRLALSIARTELILATDRTDLNLRFKWADNMQEASPLDWLVNGDTAPNGRFTYRYRAAGRGDTVVNGTTRALCSRLNGLTVTVPGGHNANGWPLVSWPYANTPNQKWAVLDAGSGFTKLIELNNGKCLEVPAAAATNGAPVLQADYSGATAQQWNLEFASAAAFDGYYKLLNRASGLALTLPTTNAGARLIQSTYTGAAGQHWALEMVSPLASAQAYVLTARHSGGVCDVAAASLDPSASVQQWTPTGRENQQWQLWSQDLHLFQLGNVLSELCLDGQNTTPGLPLQQTTWSNAFSQRWSASAVDGGTDGLFFKLKSQSTFGNTSVLSVAGAGTSNGTAIVQAGDADAPNQHWHLDTHTRTLSTLTIVPPGSTWKYFDQMQDLGTAWRTPGYDDRTWLSGPAQLGFGDGDEVTLLNTNRLRITTYFRHSFVQPAHPGLAGLTARLLRDDGAIAYLNGAEIFRSNMPGDPVTWNTFASTAVGGADENAWHSYDLNPASLRPGTNVLAVELHQNGTGSSDLSFDLELLGALLPAELNTPPALSPLPDVTVNEGDSIPPVLFTIGDAETQVSSLSVTGTSSNPLLVPDVNLRILGTGTNRILTLLPSPDASGTALISLCVSDGGTSSSRQFNLTVLPVNDPPVVTLTHPTAGALLSTGPLPLAADAFDFDDSIARVEFYLNGLRLGEATNAPYLFTIGDLSTGYYRLAAQARDQAGATATSAPVFVTVLLPPTPLVNTGALWKYVDTGANLGTAWRSNSTSDASWPAGSAPLGYGDANGVWPRTTNSFGPNANNKYITTYYRRRFPVLGTTNIAALTLNLQRDDGAIVYLNGAEILRSNMPEDPVDYRTLAPNVASGPDENAIHSANADPGLLVPGMNLLAVEVHQNATNSSDLFLELQLLAQSRPGPPPLAATLTNDTLTLSWPDWAGGLQLESAPHLTPPTPWTPEPVVPVLSSNRWHVAWPVERDTPRFFRLAENLSPADGLPD